MSKSSRMTLEDISRLPAKAQAEVQAQLYRDPFGSGSSFDKACKKQAERENDFKDKIIVRAALSIPEPKIAQRRASSKRLKAAVPSFMGSIPEYRFHPTRKCRFDHAWPDKKLALEIDGGLFINGGHSRGESRERDYEKDAEAMMLGWRVLRVSRGQFRDGHAAVWVKTILDLLEVLP